ncbi:hypothetical protein D3C78_1059760 [compost metagenome]
MYRKRKTRHDLQAGTTQAVHHGGRRHRRFRRHYPPETGRCHHQPLPAAQGRSPAPLCRAPGEGHRSRQGRRRPGLRPLRRGGRQGYSRGDPRPRFHRSRCAPVLRSRGHPAARPAPDRALRRTGHRQGTSADQDRLDLGGHPRRRDSRARRHPDQPHPAVLLRPGGCLRRCRGVPDLALRRPYIRLVQEGQQPRLHRRRRPRRAVRRADLPLFQGQWLQHRGHGRQLPQHRADRATGRLRPPDHQPGPAAPACRRPG